MRRTKSLFLSCLPPSKTSSKRSTRNIGIVIFPPGRSSKIPVLVLGVLGNNSSGGSRTSSKGGKPNRSRNGRGKKPFKNTPNRGKGGNSQKEGNSSHSSSSAPVPKSEGGASKGGDYPAPVLPSPIISSQRISAVPSPVVPAADSLIGGRMSFFLDQYAECFEEGSLVVSVARSGLSWPVRPLPRFLSLPKEARLVGEEEAVWSAELDSLVGIGAVRPIPADALFSTPSGSAGTVYSTILVVPKADGGKRPCINLAPANKFIPNSKQGGVPQSMWATIHLYFSSTLDQTSLQNSKHLLCCHKVHTLGNRPRPSCTLSSPLICAYLSMLYPSHPPRKYC